MSRLTDRTARRTATVRRKIKLAARGRTRLSVFRSSKHIYAQLIDDTKGTTLVAASSIEKSLREGAKTGANIAAAKAVGKLIAERIKVGAQRRDTTLGQILHELGRVGGHQPKIIHRGDRRLGGWL